jgi:hypothetical protein
MGCQLAQAQVGGQFAISATAPGTVVCRIPENAEEPGKVNVLCLDATATMYLKWVPLDQTGQVTSTQGEVVLALGRLAYTWDSPPRGKMLIVLSTVANALLAISGQWSVPDTPQLL